MSENTKMQSKVLNIFNESDKSFQRKRNENPLSKIKTKIQDMKKTSMSEVMNKENRLKTTAINIEFNNKIYKPYKTIIRLYSDYGKITINPVKSILTFINRIKKIHTVVINKDKITSFNSQFNDIKIQKYEKINYTYKNIYVPEIKSKLEIRNKEFFIFKQISKFLNKNITFPKIIELKIQSILSKKSTFSEISDFPILNKIIGYKSKFNNIIINNISDIIKLYASQKIKSIIQTSQIDYLNNSRAAGFIINKKTNSSLYYYADKGNTTIVDYFNNNRAAGFGYVSTGQSSSLYYYADKGNTTRVDYFNNNFGFGFVRNHKSRRTLFDDLEKIQNTNRVDYFNNNRAAGFGYVSTGQSSSLYNYADKGNTSRVDYFNNNFGFGFVRNHKSRRTLFNDLKKIQNTTRVDYFNNNRAAGFGYVSTGQSSSLYYYADKGNTTRVDYFNNNFGFGFIRDHKSRRTLFDDLEKIQNTTRVDYFNNNFGLGFISNHKNTTNSFFINYRDFEFINQSKYSVYNNKSVNYFNNDFASGFTIKDPNDSNIKNSQYIFQDKIDNNNSRFSFDWDITDYGGVLYQYVLYNDKNKAADIKTNWTFKNYINYIIEDIRKSSYNINLHEKLKKGTPRTSIYNNYLKLPVYNDPYSKLPSSFSQFQDSLFEISSKIITHHATSLLLDGIDIGLKGIGLNISNVKELKASPLIFHVIAGDIFGLINNSSISKFLNSSITNVNNVLGGAAASYLQDTATKAIANSVNEKLKANFLTEEKITMLAEITSGRKYTKSVGFYDTQAPYKHDGKTTPQVNVKESNSVLYKDEFLSNLIKARIANTTLNNNNNNNNNKIAKSNLLPAPYAINKYNSANYYKKQNTNLEFPELVLPIDTNKIYYNDNKSILINENDYIETPYQNRFENEDFQVDNQRNIVPILSQSLYKKAHFTDAKFSNRNIILNNYGIPYSIKSAVNKTDDGEITNRYIANFSIITGSGYIGDKKNSKKLQVIPDGTRYTDDDLIDFHFVDITSQPNNQHVVIPFRAIITNINNSFTAEWSSHDYIGRPEKFYVYTGIERNGNLDFRAIAHNEEELKTLWQKVNYLTGMTLPVHYPHNITMRSPILMLKVGNFIDYAKIILTSVTVNVNDANIWEIDDTIQLPMYIEVSLQYNVLFDEAPRTGTKLFAQKQDWMKSESDSGIIVNKDGITKLQ